MTSAATAAAVPQSLSSQPAPDAFQPVLGSFPTRHIGPDARGVAAMLDLLGIESLETLMDQVVPESIRLRRDLELPAALAEHEALARLRSLLSTNRLMRNHIGMGYSPCHTPSVIQRNILENPGWYTPYTPYQAEIAQGRLEALLNYQTMVIDLTGMEIANASLLDEGSAAAEAMTLCHEFVGGRSRLLVVGEPHPQTLAVLQTRAEPLGIEVVTVTQDGDADLSNVFAALLSYPDTFGKFHDPSLWIERLHAAGALAIVATDLLALTLFTPPGELGADVVVGSSQRFGVPLGYGGPHAAFFATRDRFKRQMPGRLIGVSKDARGRNGYRLSLQTREQHIRREKATSNICTAQVLLAVIASMYAVYHGPEGLRAIAARVRSRTLQLAESLRKAGLRIGEGTFFDTLVVEGVDADAVCLRAVENGMNFRRIDGDRVSISLDETVDTIAPIAAVFDAVSVATPADSNPDGKWARSTPYLTHPVFNQFHTETDFVRYIRRLETRDLSLINSMTPLGSCTMKLNATTEMIPVTWPEVNSLHPFAPDDQAAGYARLFKELENWLAEITGFAGISLQPNAGSQGELAGLIVVRKYFAQRGESYRDVCLIPTSAHGTNPASAVMAGFRVVPVACDPQGNVSVTDLRAKVEANAERLGVLMLTYPSTHGVFESAVREICEIIHDAGAQVYMDGANLNAQVGLCRPGDFGIDVCHLNLHKTFCIPHGGGGPGVGPIGVAAHLVDFLPGHPLVRVGGIHGTGPVAAAPWGSASILVISWLYIAMMGPDGLTQATRVAILNANYIARQLDPHFPVLYRGPNDLVAHECIIDLRGAKSSASVEVEDVAKRLMDYGFHSPTMSWPVPGTLMIEPTESESKAEIDRFCDAMIAIRQEIAAIEDGSMPRENNVLKNAPHPAADVIADDWDRPYSRTLAAYPAPWCLEHKYWPPVSRIDNVHGDRNLVCSCLPMEDYK